jgi:hypothetical protein
MNNLSKWAVIEIISTVPHGHQAGWRPTICAGSCTQVDINIVSHDFQELIVKNGKINTK